MKSEPRRWRVIRSFAVFALCWAIGLGLWSWARHQPGAPLGSASTRGSAPGLDDDPDLERDGAPWPFRAALEWNGKLWSALFAPDRPARPAKAPPLGKRPRVNGDLGMKDAGFDPARWRMALVAGADAAGKPAPGVKPLEVGMAEIRALPRTETATEFRCIEGWSEEISYAGVRFSDFLKHFRLDPSAFRYVGLETPDGEYYVSIDMDSMLHPQTVLAYEMNGQALSSPNGAPLRLVIPVKYGIKSLKRIGRVFLANERPRDYWAEQGYDWFSGL